MADQQHSGPVGGGALSTADARRAFDDVFVLVYEELRRLASFVRRQDAGATLNTTALVHEAWLKLRASPHLAAISLPHFKAIAARAMRQVLVEHARMRQARKRGGRELHIVAFDEIAVATPLSIEELLDLDAALDVLERVSPRQAQMVESRFFGGSSVAEVAELMGVSQSLVERDWRVAKALLASLVNPVKE